MLLEQGHQPRVQLASLLVEVRQDDDFLPVRDPLHNSNEGPAVDRDDVVNAKGPQRLFVVLALDDDDLVFQFVKGLQQVGHSGLDRASTSDV